MDSLGIHIVIFQITAIFVPSFFSEMYWAEAEPWLGSIKHIWKTLSFPSMLAAEEAEGVSAKMRSALFSTEVDSPGLEVTEPREICIPQSFRVL